MWSGELAFVEELILIDLRNNSAWNHRFFVVYENGVRRGDEDRSMVDAREIQ